MRFQIFYLCLALSTVLTYDLCATENYNNDECLQCVEGAIKYWGTCECDIGYTENFEGNKCEKIYCLFGCQLCRNEFQCLECVEGATLKDGYCECQDGYASIYDKNKCEKCPLGCKQCQNQSQCLECIEGAKLKENKCQCDDGYQINNYLETCEQIQCSQGCQVCKTGTECIMCVEHAYKQQNGCKCQQGFTLNSYKNSCEKITCPFGCEICNSSTECLQCVQGAQLNNGYCECNEGYTISDELNYCIEIICPIGCKKCNSSTDCMECYPGAKFQKEYNYCSCQMNQVYFDIINECINPKYIPEENFIYNSKKIYNQTFQFCNGTSFNEYLIDNDFKLVNEQEEKFILRKNMKRIKENVVAAQTVMQNKNNKLNLYQNYEEIHRGGLIKELKDQQYEIQFLQGNIKHETDRYIGFDIRDPESIYHFNLIINCGNVEKLEDQQIEQLLDNYFGLFYVCPPNCKDCTFQVQNVKCQKCIEQFELTGDGKCKYKFQQNKCQQPQYPSQNNTCIQVVNDELLICSNRNYCQSCLDQRNIITNMDSYNCTCLKGYYLDQRKLICEKCEELCEECEFRKGYCTQCKKGISYLDQQTNMCMECKIDNCEQCQSKKNCETCIFGYYLDSLNTQCIQCTINNCKICKSHNQCIEAKSGYFVHNDRILQCQTPYCDACVDDICTSCKDGYMMNKLNECEQCKQGCKVCRQENEQQECLSCFEGYYFEINRDFQCSPCTILNCQDCFMPHQCSKCYEGTYYNQAQKICQNCSENCLECENENRCTKCEIGYFMNDEKQCEKCLQDCEICNNWKTCQKCIAGKIMSKQKNECSCMDGCSECYLEKENDYWNENDEEKESQMVPNKEVCKKAQLGYYLMDFKTENCEYRCKECTTKYNCTTCNQGYYLQENENSCQRCSDNCKICDNYFKCDYCKIGYYLKDYECRKCRNCQECKYENSNLICMKCNQSMYLDNGKCIESNCRQSYEGICQYCFKGFYLNDERKCQRCKDNCLNCDEHHCKQCDDDYYVDGPACKHCPYSCSACELKNKVVRCLKCKQDYYLNINQQCQKYDYHFSEIIFVIIVLFLFAALYYIRQKRQQNVQVKQEEPQVQEIIQPIEQDVELSSVQFVQIPEEQ